MLHDIALYKFNIHIHIHYYYNTTTATTTTTWQRHFNQPIPSIHMGFVSSLNQNPNNTKR